MERKTDVASSKQARKLRGRSALLLAGIVLLLGISAPAGAGSGSFTNTYISCTYTVEVWDGYSAASGNYLTTGVTWESDSGCYNGDNVKNQVRAYLSSGYYLYGPAATDADVAETFVSSSSYMIFGQGKGQGKNNAPPYWSGWSSWGA